MEEVCPICEGSGLRTVERADGERFVRDCVCRVKMRAERKLAQARIPKRYLHCTLDDYDTGFRGADPSLAPARLLAKKFVECYPLETAGKGLLFCGSVGVGKTHLAVSMLKILIAERGASGVFWEHKELMESLRGAMFSNESRWTENNLIRSVTKCDILVLDDLGDMSPSEWSSDTIAYILNGRYNENLPTIITTNRQNRSSLLSKSSGPVDKFADTKQANSQATLGDRIGDRMWSRLQEMCFPVDVYGDDFRTTVNKARFG